MNPPNPLRDLRLLFIALAALLASGPLHAQQKNFMGSESIQKIQTDPTVAVPRGYIVPSATPIAGGAKIAVDLYFAQLDSGVSLYLQAAVSDNTPLPPLPPGATAAPNSPDYYILNGSWFPRRTTPEMQVIPLATLSDKVSDNPTLYHSRREFDVTYDSLNQELARLAPNAHNLKIGPGTPLFVYAKWDIGHQWGGIGRGGVVFMPDDPNIQSQVARSSSARPTELDLAFPINRGLVARFNDTQTGAGLKEGGQVRSRVETEGKYQIPVEQYDAVKKALFDIANDPVKSKLILGDDWTITPVMRYMKRDPNTKDLILDANGLPTPDPMVDTYYDNDTHEAAKNDMAIRYRWTEGNQSGSWNYKPGLTNASKEGLVTRTEYGLDTTDDKPETIAKFADSDHPLNFFKVIRQVIPGATPSDFLKPSVKVTDTRFKFLLRHGNGLAIEVSLDDVTAESLRVQGHTSRYVQMEADVEHLATQSTNSATNFVSSLMHVDPSDANTAAWLGALDDSAYLAGQPQMHDMTDVLPTSPVRQKHADDFKLAERVTVALRDHVIGKNWLPAPQKYALAAVEVGDIAPEEGSASVVRLVRLIKRRRTIEAREAAKALEEQRRKITSDVNGGAANCGGAFAS